MQATRWRRLSRVARGRVVSCGRRAPGGRAACIKTFRHRQSTTRTEHELKGMTPPKRKRKRRERQPMCSPMWRREKEGRAAKGRGRRKRKAAMHGWVGDERIKRGEQGASRNRRRSKSKAQGTRARGERTAGSSRGMQCACDTAPPTLHAPPHSTHRPHPTPTDWATDEAGREDVNSQATVLLPVFPALQTTPLLPACCGRLRLRSMCKHPKCGQGSAHRR